MSDLTTQALEVRLFAGEMLSGAADSAGRTRAQLERDPELTVIALGLAALLFLLVALVARAVRRSGRRHHASHLRDDLVDAVRMGEIDAADFRVFAMIDFCDRVARHGRRPRAGRHASNRPVLDSSLAGSLISAVGPGSLLPPGGPFWPYAVPEPGEVEVSDAWVRAVSFQRDLVGRRRRRTDEGIEPVPTPGSAPGRRRLVSVPTPATIDLRFAVGAGVPEAVRTGPTALVAADVPGGMYVMVADSQGEEIATCVEQTEAETESAAAGPVAVETAAPVSEPVVVEPVVVEPATTESGAEMVSGDNVSEGAWFLEGQARPFDPLTDPMAAAPSFQRGDEPSREMEPVFMAASEAQRAAERAAREHREQQRILRERVARRWAAIEQVAQERAADGAGSRGPEIDLRAIEVPRPIEASRPIDTPRRPDVPRPVDVSRQIDLTRIESAALAEPSGTREPVLAPARGVQPLRSLIEASGLRPGRGSGSVSRSGSRGSDEGGRAEGGRDGAGRRGAASGETSREANYDVTSQGWTRVGPAARGGLGSRHAGAAKHAVSGPIDLPASLLGTPSAPSDASDAPGSAEPAREEAPPTNPIPCLDLPVASEPDPSGGSGTAPVPAGSAPRPRWMTPGETPIASTAPVGPVDGTAEPAGDPTDDGPRHGFWARRVPRRPRPSLTEVTGHGKPSGALVPVTGSIPVQGGSSSAADEKESEDGLGQSDVRDHENASARH